MEEAQVPSDKEDENTEEHNIIDRFDDIVEPVRIVQDTFELTEEQLERIRLNKEHAERLRQERLQNANNAPSSFAMPSSSPELRRNDPDDDDSAEISAVAREVSIPSSARVETTVSSPHFSNTANRLVTNDSEASISDGDGQETTIQKSHKRIKRLLQSSDEEDENEYISNNTFAVTAEIHLHTMQKTTSYRKARRIVDSSDSEDDTETMQPPGKVRGIECVGIEETVNKEAADASDQEMDGNASMNEEQENIDKHKQLENDKNLTECAENGNVMLDNHEKSEKTGNEPNAEIEDEILKTISNVEHSKEGEVLEKVSPTKSTGKENFYENCPTETKENEEEMDIDGILEQIEQN